MKNYTTPVIIKTDVQLETINASSTGEPSLPVGCLQEYNINWNGQGGCHNCIYQRGFVATCGRGFMNKNGSNKQHPYNS